MGYVAAKGGLEAIRAAEELVRRRRSSGPSPWLETGQLIDRMRLAVDRVMGEGGLWDPEIAARALRQVARWRGGDRRDVRRRRHPGT